jgi:hypothetical protein
MRTLISIAILTLSCAMAAAQDDLPRRGLLGMSVQPSAEGLRLNTSPSVTMEGPALQAGDVILAVNEIDLTQSANFGRMLSSLAAGQRNSVRFRRDSEIMETGFIAPALPMASLPGGEAHYGHVTVANGDRIRTVTLIPQNRTLESAAGLPAVYYVQGIPCAPIDTFANTGMFRNQLFIQLLEAGFVVGFADKPGIGDSEGSACIEGGFDREVEAFRLAARALAGHAGVDSGRLYGVGVSMGGIQVPMVAQTVDMDAIVTWGTGVEPWGDYIVGNFRRRAMIRGDDAVEGDAFYRLHYTVMHHLLAEGRTPEDIRTLMPDEMAAYEAAFGDVTYFAGRHYRFHQELHAANGWGAWQDFGGRLLALHGEYDWIAGEDDHRRIVGIVNRTETGDAQFEILPGLDHILTRHADLPASFANLGQGEPSNDFQARTVEYLTALASE